MCVCVRERERESQLHARGVRGRPRLRERALFAPSPDAPAWGFGVYNLAISHGGEKNGHLTRNNLAISHLGAEGRILGLGLPLLLDNLRRVGVPGLVVPRRVPVQRFRGGRVFKAHRLLYHSTLGLRVPALRVRPNRPFFISDFLAGRGDFASASRENTPSSQSRFRKNKLRSK